MRSSVNHGKSRREMTGYIGKHEHLMRRKETGVRMRGHQSI